MFEPPLCRYVISIADSLGDGEVEQEEMTQAVATWQALLGDQEMIACTCDAGVHKSIACRALLLARSWLSLIIRLTGRPPVRLGRSAL